VKKSFLFSPGSVDGSKGTLDCCNLKIFFQKNDKFFPRKTAFFNVNIGLIAAPAGILLRLRFVASEQGQVAGPALLI
jgi:hypothetical protein